MTWFGVADRLCPERRFCESGMHAMNAVVYE